MVPVLCVSCLTLVLDAHCLQGSFFNVKVSFPAAPEPGIRFRPDEFGVTEALITNAVEGGVALLTSLPRVLHARSFVPFYEGRPTGIRLLDVTRRALLRRPLAFSSPFLVMRLTALQRLAVSRALPMQAWVCIERGQPFDRWMPAQGVRRASAGLQRHQARGEGCLQCCAVPCRGPRRAPRPAHICSFMAISEACHP